MADRSLLVRLRADVSNYRAGMAQARQETQRTTAEISKSATKHKAEWTQVGMAVGAAGALIAVGLGKAVNAAADFDRQMSQVAAVAGATAEEMEQLRGAAIQAGKDTAFSAAQSAQAISELTKAGVSTADVLGGALSGALDLAAAGGLDLASAAVIAAQGLNVFNLEGDQTSRVADTLAAGANKSAADVGSLGDALRQGGLVASQYGLDLETTVGALSLFADNALVGSDAGTSFKAMLQRLTPQSAEAAGAMEEIGFSAFNASGEFVGLESVAEQLRTGLSDLSDEQRNTALVTIFGSDAVRAAAVLYAEGAEGVAEYTQAVTDQGAASEMAATMLDNLSGDIQIFSGSVETAAIEFGEEADGMLRSVVQMGTGVVNVLADLPDPVQKVAMGLGGVASAAGLAGGAFLIAAPRIVETRAAMTTLATSMPRTVGAMRGVTSFLTGPWGVAMAAAAVGVGLWMRSQAAANDRLRDANALLDTNTGALLANAAQARAVQLQDDGLAASAERFGVSLATLTSASMGNAEAQGVMARSIDGHVAAMRAELDGMAEGTVAYDAQLSAIQRAENQSASLTGAVLEQADALDTETKATIAAIQAAEELRGSALGLGIAFEDLRNDQYQLLGATDGWTQRLTEASGAVGVTAGATAGWREMLAGAGIDTAAFGRGVESNVLIPIEGMGEALRGFADPMNAFRSTFEEDGIATLAEWKTAMEESAAAQASFAENITSLATRVSNDTMNVLLEMAQDNPAMAAQIAADMVTATDEELSEMDDVVATQTDAGIQAMEARIDAARTMAQRLGQNIVDSLTGSLQDGTSEISRIVNQYAALIAAGVNPVIQQLGGQAVVVVPGSFVPGAQGGLRRNEGGQIPGSGPDQDSVYAFLTPGEFVMRRKAVEMYGPAAMEAINDGSAAVHLNTGGFASIDDVPAVPSFGRFGSPLVDPARMAAEMARAQAVEWLKANLAPQLGPGIGSEAMMAALRTRFPGLPLYSGYRPGAVTATGNPSWHGKNRAVDVPVDLDVNRWIYDNYKSQTLELINSLSGARQVRHGRDHVYSGITRAMHFDHNHWAMQHGGRVTSPGTFMVGEGGPELAQMGMGDRVAPLDRALDVNIIGWSSAASDMAMGVVSPHARPTGPPVLNPTGGVSHVRGPSGALLDEMLRNEEMLRIEGLAAAERLLEVEEEMARLEHIGLKHTDAWVDLLREGQRLEEQIASDAQRTADEIERQADAQRDVAEAAERAARQHADQLGADLHRLLDQRDRLIDQQARATSAYATAVAEAQRKASTDIDALLAARNKALFGGFGGIDSLFNPGWANTVGQLTGNIEAQIDLFDEWADGMATLRGRGISDDLVAQLGLDDPASLAQVRLLLRANADELAELDAALAARRTQVAGQVAEESHLLLGAIGDAISDVRVRLAGTLDELGDDLHAQLADLGAQMAALGMDSGRSYAEAMAEALASGLPGVIAAAEQYQEALRDAEAAAAALANLGATTGSGSGTAAGPGGSGSSGNPWGWRNQWRQFDSGGVWQSGTAGVNLSGRDEFVLTQEQMRSMRSAPGQQTAVISGPVTIRLDDGRQLSGYIQSESRSAAAADAYAGKGQVVVS